MFNLLFNCRSNGASQIAGSADDVLTTIVDKLDKTRNLHAILNLIIGWNLSDPKSLGLCLRPHPGFKFAMEYQPTPAASAFQYLGKICTLFTKAKLFELKIYEMLSQVISQVPTVLFIC